MDDLLLLVLGVGFVIASVVVAFARGHRVKRNPFGSFVAIADRFKTFPQVQEALREAGMESCELIVGIDFTKSNEWTGKRSNEGKSLHESSGGKPSPYELVVTTVAQSLSAFDDDGQIPAYGFGDVSTKDLDVFSFAPSDAPCYGLDSLVMRYKDLASTITLSGPTSFAPLIHRAIDIVVASGGQFHLLLIIADGQVTQEADTVAAIVEASNHPMSIVCVGVGDGPFEQMVDFDDRLPKRRFDNFQFVEMERLVQMRPPSSSASSFGAAFAMQCLQEVPEQYNAMRRLGLLGNNDNASNQRRRRRRPLEPPDGGGGGGGGLPPVPSAPPKRKGASGEPLFPREFICPISQEVMEDPVFCSDGHSYERAEIEKWLAMGNRTSPMTNERLESTALIRNFTLASQISSFKGR